MKSEKAESRNAWFWIPSLYFTEGLPYVIVMTVSVIMYKKLEISNTDIALYTSWLYLPWVIKPLWSPVVDIFKTKRFWIIIMQLVIGAGLAGVALTIPTDNFFKYTLAFLWLTAFSSATHDISADGFYMIGLSKHDQAFFVGIRSTFYRIAMITGQGLLVMVAGYFEELHPENISIAWSITFTILAGLILIFMIYHKFILPYPRNDMPAVSENKELFKEFLNTFVLFFKKKNIGIILTFLLIYRLGESQLVKLAAPFLLDAKDAGGLSLSTGEVGFIYGTVGLISLTLGGLLGGILASKHGLKYWLWWMLVAINLPNAVYIYLSYVLPDSIFIVSLCVAVEQFGYGFGFTAYMLYMIYVSDGKHKTAHFAITTGFMALGMMLPGMISGWLQEMMGYKLFFIWVLLSTIPAFVVSKFIDINSDFGKKTEQA
ncbi:MAG: MFS transporter [Ignavibacteria bacterium GWB2_35_6b]|nr:MAG: MFS transporter [Ignavibacteria bacterium GWB2_35_6b]